MIKSMISQTIFAVAVSDEKPVLKGVLFDIEKDIIIYSIVRNNLKGEMGFTKSKERLNVAFSRAKKLIIMVGSSNFIQNVVKEDNKYLDVIKYINTNKEKCEIRYTNIRR